MNKPLKRIAATVTGTKPGRATIRIIICSSIVMPCRKPLSTIDPIVVEATCRTSRSYMKRFISNELRECIMRSEISPMDVDRGLAEIAKSMG